MLKNKMHPQTEFIIAIILAALFAVGTIITGLWVKAANDRWNKLTSTSTGKISGKILDEDKPYFINIGGNTKQITAKELRNGINFNQLLNNLVSFDGEKIDLPIKMYEENNRLLFDISIISNDKQLFTVIANEFVFNPDGKFDCNYSINGIEVVDENLIPRIQIYLQDGNKIFVGGSNKTDKNFLLFTPSGILANPTSEQFTKNVKAFYKYPSFKYLGVVEEKNLPDFSKIDATILENEVRRVKINEFSKLSNAELKSKALGLANSIDELQNKYFSKLSTEQTRKDDAFLEATHKQLLVEYDSQYKSEVLAIIEIIKSRLSSNNSKKLKSVSFIEWSAQSSYRFKVIPTSLRACLEIRLIGV